MELDFNNGIFSSKWKWPRKNWCNLEVGKKRKEISQSGKDWFAMEFYIPFLVLQNIKSDDANITNWVAS